MTGYGAGQAVHEGVLVKIELRSVNHRFFDPSIRLSRDFQGLEGRVKDALKQRVARGRVSATIDIGAESESTRLVLDAELANEYRTLFQSLEETHGFPLQTDAVTFAQLPDLVRRESRELPEEAVEKALDSALEVAVEQLAEMRRQEGEALGRDLSQRLQRLDGLLDSIEQAAAGAAEKVRDRIMDRVTKLVPDGLQVDPDRIAQEVALLADRADIVEELVRFRAHNDAFRAFLQKGEPVGKRLDFLLQEMNREVNTIGSKSSEAGIAHLVVEVKEEIERLREQVQNIE
ncbi:MAG: hypothetical protein DHS20C21_17790 [Gemmatimonadota bacterium]|nr:MAG: hypothetical protein DHS20C21_17790 [Gemmatimonadota bacterium]